MLNQCNFIGRLGQDPTVRYKPDGGQVTSFSVATDEAWKDKQTGERVTRTEWINVVTFGKLAEICGKYLTKGKLVFVSGKIQAQQWTDKDGGKHSKTQIVADTMKMLDQKGQDREEYPADPGERKVPAAEAPREQLTETEDVPF